MGIVFPPSEVRVVLRLLHSAANLPAELLLGQRCDANSLFINHSEETAPVRAALSCVDQRLSSGAARAVNSQ